MKHKDQKKPNRDETLSQLDIKNEKTEAAKHQEVNILRMEFDFSKQTLIHIPST